MSIAAEYAELRFDGDTLLCPRCGERNLHHVHVIVYERKEDDRQATRIHAQVLSQA
jgi:hypothetical protein